MAIKTEEISFKVSINGTGSDKPCQFKISIDDTILVQESSKIDIEHYEFKYDLRPGIHELKIELVDKSASHTVKDSNGNLIEDFLLNIESIEIDDIELGNLIWRLSEYYPIYPDSYTDTEQKSKSVVKNCVNLGWNGTWVLKFESPIYIWLLENI